MNNSLTAYRQARDFLLSHRNDYAAAYAGFTWPKLVHFNWALDHFDDMARNNNATALWIVNDDGSEQRVSFAQMSQRSDQVANWLTSLGVQRGDRVMLMLGNEVPLWELMLACIKMGAIIIPATALLAEADLQDRLTRGQVRVLVTSAEHAARIDAVITAISGDTPLNIIKIASDNCPQEALSWYEYADSKRADAMYKPLQLTRADEPLLLYFTSGTTSKPKLVQHTHTSYPVGHLSTVYWLGLRANDVHWNISSPGWGKHAWSSFFAPWSVGACVFIFNMARFDAKRALYQLTSKPIASLCAPPTVWRLLIQEKLSEHHVSLRELISAGEPLNPEVIAQVREAWGVTIRDGYGQTETTALVGNPPGEQLTPGAMGKPLPGFRIVLLDVNDQPASEGEICIDLKEAPTGVMAGYSGDAAKTAEAMHAGYFHTGDIASSDKTGTLIYVGRADDVFKASDYRISPFELESVLIEHPAVAEAAVVPSPDALKLAVPKAFVVISPGFTADTATAMSILQFCRDKLAPYKRIRRLEFAELPKTISGKIRRVELRKKEEERAMPLVKGAQEYFDDELRG
jgi:acetyl-CoA synthetase